MTHTATPETTPKPQTTEKLQTSAPPNAGGWTATATTEVDTVRLAVHGVLQEPTPGYTLALTRVTAAGGDPATLLLHLTVKAPTGIEPQHVVQAPVDYAQTFVIPRDHVPTQVVILTGAATVAVHPAPRPA